MMEASPSQNDLHYGELLHTAVTHWTANELSSSLRTFKNLLGGNSPSSTLSSPQSAPIEQPTEPIIDQGNWYILDYWDERQDLLLAVDEYYGKRLLLSRFIDWHKRLQRVKALKSSEEGHRAGQLIRSLRNYTDGKRQELHLVQQGANHWQKGEQTRLSRDIHGWFNKLRDTKQGNSLLAKAEMHQKRTEEKTLKSTMDSLLDNSRCAARAKAVSECDPATLLEAVGIELPLAKYRAQVAMVDAHYNRCLARCGFTEWKERTEELCTGEWRLSHSRFSRDSRVEEFQLEEADESSLSPSPSSTRSTSSHVSSSDQNEMQQAMSVASTLLRTYRCGKSENPTSPPIISPSNSPALNSRRAMPVPRYADVVRSQPIPHEIEASQAMQLMQMGMAHPGEHRAKQRPVLQMPAPEQGSSSRSNTNVENKIAELLSKLTPRGAVPNVSCPPRMGPNMSTMEGMEGFEVSTSMKPNEIEAKAEAGDAEAQFLLGCLHGRRWQAAAQANQGKKGKKDSALQSKAMAWFERAARQGHQNAMYALAQIGLDQNVAGEVQERAAQWLRQAAELGMPSAQALLGEMYGKGYVSSDGKFWLDKDYHESARWLSIAGDQSSTLLCLSIAGDQSHYYV